MKKLKPKKPKIIYLIVLVALLIIAAACIAFMLNRTTTLVEDVNNRCDRVSDDKKLVTGVGRKYVYFEIPSYQANNYLKKALAEGRCVSKKEVLPGP